MLLSFWLVYGFVVVLYGETIPLNILAVKSDEDQQKSVEEL
jgi:hypothetical protein